MLNVNVTFKDNKIEEMIVNTIQELVHIAKLIYEFEKKIEVRITSYRFYKNPSDRYRLSYELTIVIKGESYRIVINRSTLDKKIYIELHPPALYSLIKQMPFLMYEIVKLLNKKKVLDIIWDKIINKKYLKWPTKKIDDRTKIEIIQVKK
jgi:hypothetical protein